MVNHLIFAVSQFRDFIRLDILAYFNFGGYLIKSLLKFFSILIGATLKERESIFFPLIVASRGESTISGKEVHIYKDLGVRFADFISIFVLNIL